MNDRQRPDLDEVWTLLQEQQKEIAELRRQNEQLQADRAQSGAQHTDSGGELRGRRVSRAGMLKAATAGAAATVGAGALIQARTPLAAAATGSNIIAGQQTTAENPTSLYYDTTTTTGVMFLVSDNGDTGSSAAYPAALGGWSYGNAAVANGVYGFTTVAGGSGVVGWSDDVAGAGNDFGVYGRVASATTGSAGVFGEATNTAPGPNTSGVFGRCDGTNASSLNGNGVYGYHSGGGYGVYGISLSGFGVVGLTSAAGKPGVAGYANAAGAYGVFGSANGNSGAFAGVFNGNVSVTNGYTTSHNPSGHGVLGTSDATHYGGLSGATTVSGGAGLIGSNSNVAGAYGGLIYGPLVVTGTKSAAVTLQNGTRKLVYCVEMPDCYLEDVGRAHLVNGQATVALPVDFAPLIDRSDYYVFLTALGSSDASLSVSEQHADRFVVVGQHPATAFQYRIMGKRVDVHAERLAAFDVPEPAMLAPVHAPTIPASPNRPAPEPTPSPNQPNR